MNKDEIIGQIKNLDDDSVEFIKIGVTGYDSDGNIVGTDDTYSNADTLKHNQKSAFSIPLSKDLKDMKTYDLFITMEKFIGC